MDVRKRRIRRFLLWLLPARRVVIDPEVCPRCGTASCLEDRELDW